MSPEQKRWAWIGGLAAGTAALVGTIVLWPKKASASSSSKSGTKTYYADFTNGTFQRVLNIGEDLEVAIPPSLMSNLHMDDFDGIDTIIGVAEDAAHFRVDSSTGYGYLKFVAVGKGKATAILGTKDRSQAMTINFVVA